MRFVIFFFFLASAGIYAQEEPLQGDFIISTFNIHYISPGQGKMDWQERRHAALQAVTETGADIIGFQEMETFIGRHINRENRQLDFLREHLPDYEAAAVGDATEFPITQPLLYRPDRLEFLEQGFFFFSETPDRIYSRTFNGSYPAFCVWVRFRDRQHNRDFYVFNMHNDYRSRSNRITSSRLILERMAPLLEQGHPVILLGDFNALRSFKTVRMFRPEGFSVAETKGSSFHFNRGRHLFPAIDHILFTQQFVQTDARILRKSYGGVYPSDHYPVTVGLEWK